ncbi:MAG: hypothetical protein HY730_04625 [Candidatus Tectomicrobia bacterium]|uniref:PIN-like domain-containing protein n=1 Tax=Tectimicrobiota bacterium TaxID=2528274 RepID=A0A933LPZ7_UNCTE|nr:hypothetical protein [Candidatus Tectomicrobia bacterium]
MMDSVLLIDYENVQQVDISEIDKESYSVKVFVGASQNKIPFDVVTAAQAFGPSLEWIKIDADGKNALDFHIAYFLGKYSQAQPHQKFIVLSKDTGFDPLVRFLNKNGTPCSRINSLLELDKNKIKGKPPGSDFEKAISNLKKIDPNKRPRTRSTLTKHFKTALGTDKDSEVNTVIDLLFMQGIVYEEGARVKYKV